MKEISIGRVITTERGKGYGKQIMLRAIEAAIEHFNATLIDIEAQEYAKGFYEGMGFRQSSDTFMLDGIPHIKMTWTNGATMRDIIVSVAVLTILSGFTWSSMRMVTISLVPGILNITIRAG